MAGWQETAGRSRGDDLFMVPRLNKQSFMIGVVHPCLDQGVARRRTLDAEVPSLNDLSAVVSIGPLVDLKDHLLTGGRYEWRRTRLATDPEYDSPNGRRVGPPGGRLRKLPRSDQTLCRGEVLKGGRGRNGARCLPLPRLERHPADRNQIRDELGLVLCL